MRMVCLYKRMLTFFLFLPAIYLIWFLTQPVAAITVNANILSLNNNAAELNIKNIIYITVKTGNETKEILTSGKTVKDALVNAGIKFSPWDVIKPALETPITSNATIEFKKAIPVTIIYDNISSFRMTLQPNVKDLLKEQNISIGESDIISPSQNTPITLPMTIKITRIKKEQITETDIVSYASSIKFVTNLIRGEKKTAQQGKNGVIERTMEIVYTNGKFTSNKVLAKKILVPSQPEIILAGIKPRHLLASRGGFFTHAKAILEMEASAYDPGPISCGKYADGYTSIGLKAGYGIVAVDPRVIPLRTRLFIEGYGYAIAGDIGSAIKGNRIDLGFDTYQEAIRFGRKRVKVYILN